MHHHLHLNSNLDQSTPKSQQQQQLAGKHQQQQQQQQKRRIIGPTFLFKFYCRGANENDVNQYKTSLRNALNDALLIFLSEYITHIDADSYTKLIEFTDSPVEFRNTLPLPLPLSSSSSTTLISNQQQQQQLQENQHQHHQQQQQQQAPTRTKMRFKSAGNEQPHAATSTSTSAFGSSSVSSTSSTSSAWSTSFVSLIHMNKTALATKLGEQLANQQALSSSLTLSSSSSSSLLLLNAPAANTATNSADESVSHHLQEPATSKSHSHNSSQDLYMFIMNNIKNNLFDHRDYQDTIEYFREASAGDAISSSCIPMARFDFYKILNQFIVRRKTNKSLAANANANNVQDVDEPENEEAFRSNSLTEQFERKLKNKQRRRREESDNDDSNHSDESSLSDDESLLVYHKSHLRLIYEWLKGLYLAVNVAKLVSASSSPPLLTPLTPSTAAIATATSSAGGVQSAAALAPSSTLTSSSSTSSTSSSLSFTRTMSAQQQLQQQQQQRILSPMLGGGGGGQHSSPSPLSNNPSNATIQTPLAQSSTILGGSSSSSSASSSSTAASSLPPFVMRKKFNYKSKYNLINLLRELEHSVKETCKCETVGTCYFSFKSSAVQPPTSAQKKRFSTLISSTNDSVFYEQTTSVKYLIYIISFVLTI